MTAQSSPLMVASLLAYAAAAVLYQAPLLARNDRLTAWALRFAYAALVLHTGVLVQHVEQGQWRLADVREVLLVFAWVLLLVYLITRSRYAIDPLGALVVPLGMLSVLAVAVAPQTQIRTPPPELDSLLQPIHVLLAVAAYGAFLLAFASALAYLLKERLLKSKRLTGLARRLPALEEAEQTGYRFAVLGLLLWTAMIGVGMAYNQAAVARLWTWDPKQTLSLVTWIVYAGYLHARLISEYRGRTAVLMLAVGFGFAVLTGVGVYIAGDPLHASLMSMKP